MAAFHSREDEGAYLESLGTSLKRISDFMDGIYTLPRESDRFRAMEGLRGYAVLLIFCTHFFNEFLRRYRHANLNPTLLSSSPFDALLFYLMRSHYGVDLFFLLSGFLIFRIIKKDRTHFSYLGFIMKRVLRIYPAFLIALFFGVYIFSFKYKFVQFDVLGLVENLFFLNAINELHIGNYNPVTWSLLFEFVFYFTVPAVLLFDQVDIMSFKKKFIAFSLVVSFLVWPLGSVYTRFLMFFPGAFVALWDNDDLKKISSRIPEPAVILVYVLSTAWFIYNPDNFKIFTPIFLITATGLFIKTCFGDGSLNRLFSYRPVRYLGNISFSFYLVHYICIVIIFQELPIDPSRNSAMILAILLSLSFGLSLALSTVLFQFVEKRYFLRNGRYSMQKQEETVITA